MGLVQWDDTAPSIVTPLADEDFLPWTRAQSGPGTGGNLIRSVFNVQGSQNLVVGPTLNQAQYTDIQSAVNALAESRHNGIHLLNGEYQLESPLYLPERDISIEAAVEGGAIIKNNPGDDGIVITDRTKNFWFRKFSMASQNVAAYSNMIKVEGTSAPNNTSSVLVEKVSMDLVDTGTPGSGVGDIGLMADTGNAVIQVLGATINNGKTGLCFDSYENILAQGNFLNSQIDHAIYVPAGGTDSQRLFGNWIKDFKKYGIRSISTATLVELASNHLFSTTDDTNTTMFGINVNNASLVDNEIVIQFGNNGELCYAVFGVSTPGIRNKVIGTVVKIDVTTTAVTFGVALESYTNSVISNNPITVDNDNNGNEHFGMNFNNACDRNTIEGNNVNMINNDAQDTSFELNGDNNVGEGNLSYLAGTDLDDNGVGNNVSVQGV